MCFCMGVCMPAYVCLFLCQYPHHNKEAQTEAACHLHCPGRTWTVIILCLAEPVPIQNQITIVSNLPHVATNRCSPQTQHRGTNYFSCQHEKSAVTLTSSLKLLLLPFLLSPMRIECAESVT